MTDPIALAWNDLRAELKFKTAIARERLDGTDWTSWIEKMDAALAASAATKSEAPLSQQFEAVIAALKYDGTDIDSLTVGEIRRAL